MSTKTQDPVIGDGSLHVGDRVVYPNQGICRITGVDIKQTAVQNWEVVTLAREEDGATVMVPRAKVMGIGLRKVADVAAIDRVFDELATPNTDPQLDWKVRHRENADRMTGGGLFGTVEVLKGLHALSRVRPLPQKERELYDSARHLIVGEIAAAMGIPVGVAENNLDYALFPPPGMKRKGKELLPAAIPATAGPPRRDDGDDDLGFDDEAAAENGEGEAAPKAGARPATAAADEDEDEDDSSESEENDEETKVAAAVKPGAAAKSPAAARAATAGAAVAAPGPRAAPKAGPAAAPKPAAKAAKPAAAPNPKRSGPASKAAKARPAARSKAAPKAKAPATKAAAKKPAAKKGKR